MAEKKVKIIAIIDAETTGYQGKLSGVENRTKKTGSVMQGIFQGIGQQMTRIFVDVARAAFRKFVSAFKFVGDQLVDAVRLSADFGEALSEVATLGIEDMDSLRAGVLDLSASMGLDLVNSVQGLYQAISAGVPEDNVLDFLEVSSQLAVAGLTDLETTVDGLTSVVNSYGLSFDRAREISDMMFTTVRLGKTQIGELAQFIGRVTPLASQMGIEFDEVSAILASATRSGVRTRLAVTGLRSALSNLMMPGMQAQKVFAEMGLTVEDVGERIREGGMIQFLRELTPEQLKGVITSVDGLNTVLATIGKDGGAQFQQFLGEIQAGAGATEKAVEKVMQTTKRQWEIMSKTWDAIRAELALSIDIYAGKALQILNEKLLTPLRTEIAPMIGLALEGFFAGDSAQKALETIGIWSSQVIKRMGSDLALALEGEIQFGEMIGAWIREGWVVIRPQVKEIAREMIKVFIDVAIITLKESAILLAEEMERLSQELPFLFRLFGPGYATQLAGLGAVKGIRGLLPSFHDGGLVPDLLGGGREYPVMVEPGERIINKTDGTDRAYNVTINVSGAGDPQAVAMEVKRVLRDAERWGRGFGRFEPELA